MALDQNSAVGDLPHVLRAQAPTLLIAATRRSLETHVFGGSPIRVENPSARTTPSGARMLARYVTIAKFGNALYRLVKVA